MQKNATLRFLQWNLKKRNPKFEVSDFADFSLHGISNTALKLYVYNIYGISTCIKDNKSDWVWYLGLKF